MTLALGLGQKTALINTRMSESTRHVLHTDACNIHVLVFTYSFDCLVPAKQVIRELQCVLVSLTAEIHVYIHCICIF